MEYHYAIGGKTYTQRPLVFGQIKQLMPLFEGLAIPRQFDIVVLTGVIGDRLPQFLAIVLTEEGQSLREKDIGKSASLLEYEITAEQTVQVVEDFFACNPAASLLERLTGIIGKLFPKPKSEIQNPKPAKIGSKKPSSPLQEEMLPNGTPFFGAIRQESASPGLNTEPGK